MKQNVPTILVIIAILIGITTGVFLLNNQQIFGVGAQNQPAPENVRVSNITNEAFRVSWTTATDTTGFLMFKETDNGTAHTANNDVSGNSTVHSATATGLMSDTRYSFSIDVGGENFDNNGINWQTTTGPQVTKQLPIEPISGTVITNAGIPAVGSIVYLIVGGASPASSIVSSSGNWVIPLSNLRTQDLSSYYQVTEETPLELFVQSRSSTSTAYAYAQNLRPSDAIVTGESYDFRNQKNIESNSLPKANIDLPESLENESNFDVKGITTEKNSDEITLNSLKEGEIVTSINPEFFGEGPVGIKITITIQSDPQTDQITVDDSGNWKWSPPENLEEGTHKLVLSWTDENGILRSITKNFVVQAQEAPAFESTPSSTPTSSPSATPAATPTPTATASAAPIPDSGTLTPTLVLFIMGISLLIFGGATLSFATKDN